MTTPGNTEEGGQQSGMVRKAAVAVGGSAVTAAGVVMLVTPGPGILTIAAGLAILGSEFRAPRRVLDRLRPSRSDGPTPPADRKMPPGEAP